MKTTRITALLAAMSAFAAVLSCSKDTDSPGGDEPQVTVINADIVPPSTEGETKTSLGELKDGVYPVLWTKNDAIAVSNQSASTFVTYTTTADKTQSGKFITTETAPQNPVYSYYPAGNVTGVSSSIYTVTIPATQSYVEGSFANGAFPMYASATNLSEGLTFSPLMSVLKLQLTGSKTVKKIVVTSDTENLSGTAQVNVSDGTLSWTAGSKKVELDCGDGGVELTSAAKTFHIVLPAAAAKNYYVSIVTDASTPYQGVVKYLSGKTFTAGKIKKMSAVDVASAKYIYIEGSYMAEATYVGGSSNSWWAPVNCGYDSSHKYGLLYQWGRKVGTGYSGETGIQTATEATYTLGYNKDPDAGTFYYIPDKPGEDVLKDWYTNSTANQLSAWPMKSGDTGYVADKIDNPCPSGWRVPTEAELSKLNEGGDGKGAYEEDKGFWFNGTTSPAKGSGICLPAAGFRGATDGDYHDRTNNGNYWASNTESSKSRYFYIYSEKAYIDTDNDRATGYSVRCIKE